MSNEYDARAKLAALPPTGGEPKPGPFGKRDEKTIAAFIEGQRPSHMRATPISGYNVDKVSEQTREIITLAEIRREAIADAIVAHNKTHNETMAKLKAGYRDELTRLQAALLNTERVILAEKSALGVLMGAEGGEAAPEPAPEPSLAVAATLGASRAAAKRKTRKPRK